MQDNMINDKSLYADISDATFKPSFLLQIKI